MQHRTATARTTTRLAAAVAAVLALTTGAGVLAAPAALAAPSAPSATASAGSTAVGPVRSLPAGASLRSAGAQGYIVTIPTDNDSQHLRWIPYAGGEPRDDYRSFEWRTWQSGDAVTASLEGYDGSFRNMATGESFGMEGVPGWLDAEYAGTAGAALGVRAFHKVYLDTKDAAPREITGLPAGATYGTLRPATDTVGLLDHETAAGERRVGLVDLATATVTESYAHVEAVSATRVAWTEAAAGTTPRQVVVRDRTSGAETVVPMPSADTHLPIALLGDWLLYGPSARHLVTGETVTLFDRVDTLTPAPDRTAAVVQGSTAGNGEGMHRVALGADGKPVARLLARKGTTSSFVHDIDADGFPDLLGRDSAGALWRDSAGDGRTRVSIGTGWKGYDKIEVVGEVGPSSPLHASPADVVARDASGVLWLHQGNGDGFQPRVRIGGGWQTYDKIAGGSDLTGDGVADLVAIDTTGGLYLYQGTGSLYSYEGTSTITRPYEPRKKIGTGWGIYNQLTAVGDIAGASGGDLVARDRDGVLWLYLGKGDGTYTARTRIGGGWQVYGQITGAGDVDHDGRADVLAHDPATDRAYLYSGTGDRLKPFRTWSLTDLHAGAAYNHIA
ncbi:FG-GAP repeat domain-containing protein [Streptomyces hydrogenans]|uniref:FG-GAP repeat domain-containing protein n=1 Tax=Streptomyces hydrogenans TaxID=1873719 RepID=UPI0036CD0A24